MKVSYIGMKTQEIPIKSGTIRIILKPDAEVLEEVVVTGMQKMDKRLFTGAATKYLQRMQKWMVWLTLVVRLRGVLLA